MMQELLRKYQLEKQRLNELGEESLNIGIPLGENEEVHAQSRKVDELILQFYTPMKNRINS